jgi:hypothetical protein
MIGAAVLLLCAAPVQGLDHIPIAVKDLERAGDDYRKLGFTLKPGRAHENGIRNLHAKFKDGSELELITAAEARDAMTAGHLAHLRKGDGPADIGFHAPDREAVAAKLHALKQAHVHEDGLVLLPSLHMFFGVWYASDAPPKRMLGALGAIFSERELNCPGFTKAAVAAFADGKITFLPASRQLVPGRPVIGAVLRTRDVDASAKALHLQITQTPAGRSLFVPPERAHGLWLEFREQR